jgi:hypothetical protein
MSIRGELGVPGRSTSRNLVFRTRTSRRCGAPPTTLNAEVKARSGVMSQPLAMLLDILKQSRLKAERTPTRETENPTNRTPPREPRNANQKSTA